MNITPNATARAVRIQCVALVLASFAQYSGAADRVEPVSGTTGTPLGGFGAGGLKFNANDGSFAAMIRPPADAYDFVSVPEAQFQLTVRRGQQSEAVAPLKARVTQGRPEDDAVWPIHRVQFDRVHGVDAKLVAFSPFDRVDQTAMTLPCALYEITFSNVDSTPAQVDFALQWSTKEKATALAGKGIVATDWAVFAATADGQVLGDVSSADGKVRTTVQLKVAAGESKTVRFVVAWYNRTEADRSFYQGQFTDPAAVAEKGLADFEKLKRNGMRLVDRMMGSNLPDWLKHQSLNTLVNYTTNSMYKRDGRLAFAEGQWTCFGTMDQMWHARQIVAQLTPEFAWQELRYWARTQRKDGQIHHDFNFEGGSKDKAARSVLVEWDDTEHADYRNIDKWVDLNCAYIISVFEAYRLTGNTAELEFHWPHLNRALNRIFDQVRLYGSKTFPFTFEKSENSYDAGGDPDPFNAGLSAVAYKAMKSLADEKGDAAVAEKCQAAYAKVVDSFRARYLQKPLTLGKHCESILVGQWLALHLKLGEIWSADETDRVLAQIDTYYHPFYWGMGVRRGTYDEWTPYVLTHLGGLLLNTRRANQWQAMQFDSNARQYDDRNRVFSHPLDVLPKPETPKAIATDIRSKKQYISMPALWRNYYDVVGYHRDVSTRTLWLTPILPDGLNHQMTDAFYVSPEGDGTLSCTESGDAFQNQDIWFRPDRPLEVKTLRLADRYGNSVSVRINDKGMAVRREGAGYAKELVVEGVGTVGPEGLHVSVTGDPGPAAPPLPAKPTDTPETSPLLARLNPYKNIQAVTATKAVGTVAVEGKITSCNNFDYLEFDKVDFGGKGPVEFSAKVKPLARDVTIDIVLDSVSGDSIGTCQLSAPTGDGQWVTVKAATKKIIGVHDVFLRFSGSSPDDLVHIESFKFTKG